MPSRSEVKRRLVGGDGDVVGALQERDLGRRFDHAAADGDRVGADKIRCDGACWRDAIEARRSARAPRSPPRRSAAILQYLREFLERVGVILHHVECRSRLTSPDGFRDHPCELALGGHHQRGDAFAGFRPVPVK